MKHVYAVLVMVGLLAGVGFPQGEAVQAGPSGVAGSGQWSTPITLFEDDLRIAAGAKLHTVGVSGGHVLHRSSADEGASWSSPVVIPGAGTLPIYGPVAAENTNVYVLTRSSNVLRVQRSTDSGGTWSSPVTLRGYSADSADRVQMAAEGNFVHVFVGRAGATADPSFKVYYWRSTNAGLSFSDVAILDDSATEPPSPGGIAVENGVVHIAYAAITNLGTLGHRARYLRSLDNGITWSSPVNVSGSGSNPQIRPRPRVLNGRVLVLWEEPLDHDQRQPYPNATRSEIRANISPDNGTTWDGPQAIAAVPQAYVNHPEVAVGPNGFFHVIYRISVNQSTLTNDDPMGYRSSANYGSSWRPYEIAIDDPTRETHPVNLVATSGFVHAASAMGLYVLRPLAASEPTDVGAHPPTTQKRFLVSMGGPNPSFGEIRIRLALPKAGDVDVRVVDVAGRSIKLFEAKHLDAGDHEFIWNGESKNGERVPAGVYFVFAKAPGETHSTKIVLMR